MYLHKVGLDVLGGICLVVRLMFVTAGLYLAVILRWHRPSRSVTNTEAAHCLHPPSSTLPFSSDHE